MVEEEVDLKDLYNTFKKTTIYYYLESTVNFVLKNNIWFILFLLIGATYGYYTSSKILPIYKSDMVIDSRHMKNLTSEEIINSLKTIVSQQNTEELNKINFSPKVASKILSIDFVYPKISLGDSIFKIEVVTHDNSSFKDIESNVFNYIQNNAYSSSFKNGKNTFLNRQKTDLLKSIEIIDSLLINPKKNEIKAMNSSSLYIEKIRITSELTIIENKLNLVEGINLVRGFTPKLSPEAQKDYSILKFGFLFLIIGGILLRFIKRN